MRIKSLTLQDVGVFRGRQTLDLYPRRKYGSERPVILVGGHNGAGKSTILGALQLALYGRLALGPRVSDREYSDHLRGLIHRRKDTLIPFNSASVAVEFEHARAGERCTYTVQRTWQVVDERAEERLSVLRNGSPLSDVEAEFWPEFVRGLVPYGLSQLFFFDGEKIQRLAETQTESEELGESVKALLGLDLVERLQADLDVLIERRARTSDSSDRNRQVEEIDRRLAEIEKHDHGLEQQQAQLQTSLDRTTAQAERIEQKLSHSGKGLASRRGELRTKGTEVTVRIEGLERQLRDLCESALPFALCPRQCDAVIEQLDREAAAESWSATRHELQDAFGTVKKRLAKRLTGTGRLASDVRSVVLAEVAAVFQDIETSKGELANDVPIHGASETGRSQLRQVLGAGHKDAAAQLHALSKELLVAEERMTSVKRRLEAAPDNEELRPLIKELGDVHTKRGELSGQMATIADARAEVAREFEKLQRDRRKIVEAQADQAKGDSHIALATRARRALAAYLERLTATKVERLQVEAVACFKQLCRKEDLIESMTIDPRTFAVTLRDRRGAELPKQDLSAGEKQLYAVALLSALARVSGRPLPMVVDTPLGRLDRNHRHNLIERYFPHASHQVIILSTDTEVDQGYFESLRPVTSHTLHLQHHVKDAWTEVGPGYFWKGESLAAANA